MARWPRNFWTSLFTYLTIFVVFPILCARGVVGPRRILNGVHATRE